MLHRNPAANPTALVDDRGGSGLDYDVISVLQTPTNGVSALILVGHKTTDDKSFNAKEK
jgi:hypothetical protein